MSASRSEGGGAPAEAGPRAAEGHLDPGLRALVRVSAEVARGQDARFRPVFDEALSHAEVVEVEEALLQSYLFVGYPAALNAIAAWRGHSGLAPPPDEGPEPESWPSLGEETCRRVYGSAYPSLRDNIAGLRPEMDRWMVHEGYGKVLSRRGLALWRRECCIVAVLAVLGAGPQLRSHLRGALRAGAPPGVVAAVLEAVEPQVPAHRRDTVREVWEQVRIRWEQR